MSYDFAEPIHEHDYSYDFVNDLSPHYYNAWGLKPNNPFDEANVYG